MIALFKEHKTLFYCFLILSFLFYGNSLKNKYALDDDYITVTNFPIKGQQYSPNHGLVAKGFMGIPKIWKSRYAHDGESTFEYRPVTTSSFAIEYAIFVQNPFISHLVNILLYFFTVSILFCVLISLFESIDRKLEITFLTCLLFLIHPLHTEVVNNIKCRDELFAMLFPLIAFWYSLKFYKKANVKYLFLIFLFLLLGILSKKSAMIFVAIIPLGLIFFRKINIKVFFSTTLFLVISYLSFTFIKGKIITEKSFRNLYDFENPLYSIKISLVAKMIAGLKTLGFYLKLFLFPYPLRFYYGGNFLDVYSMFDIYAILAIFFLGLAGFYYFKTKNKLFLFGLLLFLGSIFPFLNFMVPVAGVYGERLAYISSIGFSVMIISIIIPFIKNTDITQFSGLTNKPKIYGLAIIFISMIYTWNRNSAWYDKLTLFENDIVHLEKSAKANSLIANEYFEQLRNPNLKSNPQTVMQKCIKHYSQAVTNDSSFFSAYNNAGVVYYSYLKDYTRAKKLFTLAIRHRPLYSQAHENLGNCYKQERNIAKAYWCYKKSYEIDPKQYSAYIALINMFFEEKNYDKCLEIIDIARFNVDNNYELTAQEANCYLMKKDLKKAIEKYEEAYQFNPNPDLEKFISQKRAELNDSLSVNQKK